MSREAAVERLYILDGGTARVEDASIYSPGFYLGRPMVMSCNAYLIRHRGEWMLWDTGTRDDIYELPGGSAESDGFRGTVTRTIASQLEEIGVGVGDVSTLAISHAHYDHVGNCQMFRNARWIAQRAEYDAMFSPDPTIFGYEFGLYESLQDNETAMIAGDHDVYGDGAVRIISTPGHTPGHCSLLVNLPGSGKVLLSGDVAHNRRNFRCRCVPAFNADPVQSVASMDKVDRLLKSECATLWVNHDIVQSGTLPHAPQWII